MTSPARFARPNDDAWIVAVHDSRDGHSPVGSGVLIDHYRVLTCAHVACPDGRSRPELWLAFPKSRLLMNRKIRVRSIALPPADHSTWNDVAVLELEEEVAERPARLRQPESRELIGRDWWSFGFPNRDEFGMSAFGVIDDEHGFGWIGVKTESGPQRGIVEGYSGAALWSSAYDAVVGIVGQANRDGNARAYTIHQAAASFADAKLDRLTDWSVEAVEESALASWGWSLSTDSEATRHWMPRARGVARDSERGFRFRGRHTALTELARWITSEQPQHTALVVTGSPGVGKSAVLGRIVTSADAGIAASLPAEDEVVRAPIGSVACAVHAKSKTALDVAIEIARAASAPLPQQTGDLAIGLGPALEGRGRERFSVIIDALDEAASAKEARDIIRWIVRPLVEDLADAGVRVVVGTRLRDHQGDLLATFGQARTVIDLDDPRYFELDDLTAYALASLQLLGAERYGNPYEEHAVAAPVAERIAQLSAGNFLVSGLIARAHGLHDAVPVSPKSIKFSPNVDEALNEFLERIPPVGSRSAHELLTALAYAEAPGFTVTLWNAAVIALFGVSPGEGALRGFARASAANFLVEDSAASDGADTERAYRLFHQALNDVLLEARDARTEDERLLTSTFLQIGRNGGWGRAPAYLLRSLPGHAQRGNAVPRLVEEDEYPLYADLRRLVRTALRSADAREAVPKRLRLLRKSQRAIDAPPAVRAALLSVVEAQEQLGTAYRDAEIPSAYRAAWAQTEPEEEQAVLEGHLGAVTCVTALPTGTGRQLLASAGEDGTVRLWDPETGENLRIISEAPQGGATNTVCAVPSVTDSALLASGGSDGTVRLWDPETGELVRAMDGRSGQVIALCALTGPGGAPMLAGLLGARTVEIWDPSNGESIATLPKIGTGLLAFTPLRFDDGHDRLAIGTRSGAVHLWDPFTGSYNPLAQGYAQAATALCAIPRNGKRPLLAVAGAETTVRIWDIGSGEHVGTLEQGASPVSALCTISLGGDRTLLAATSGKRALQIWDPTDVTSLHKLTSDTDTVRSVCPVQPDEGQSVIIATGGNDGTIRLWAPWNPSDQARQRARLGMQTSLRARRGRDGETLLYSRNQHGDTLQWDPDSGALMHTWPRELWGAKIVFLVAQDHDAPLLASASSHGLLTMSFAGGQTRWSQETGQSAGRHFSAVNAMTIMKGDSRDLMLVTASSDGTARRWDARTGEMLGKPLLVGRPIYSICSLRRHDAPTQPFIAAACDRFVRVWQQGNDEPLWDLEQGENTIASVFPIPTADGPAMLGYITETSQLHLWDLENGRRRHVIKHDTPWLTTAHAFVTESGRTLIAAGGADRVLRLWDLNGRSGIDVPVRHEIFSIASARNRLFLGMMNGIMSLDVDDSRIGR